MKRMNRLLLIMFLPVMFASCGIINEAAEEAPDTNKLLHLLGGQAPLNSFRY